MKNSLKTLAVWLIIGIIFIVLITSILGNTDNKLSYSELLAKVDAGEVTEIRIDSSGTSADVKLKNDNLVKEVNIPSIDSLMTSLQEPMKTGTIEVVEESESIFMMLLSLLTPFGILIIFFIFWFLLMNNNQGGSKTMSFGKSKAKLMNGAACARPPVFPGNTPCALPGFRCWYKPKRSRGARIRRR